MPDHYDAHLSSEKPRNSAEAERPITSGSFGSSLSSSSSFEYDPQVHRLQSRNTELDLERHRTGTSRALSRTETQRTQHALTVGESLKSRPSRAPLPPFGGGKAYPPLLPAREDYVVEFDGPDDPLYPLNWPVTKNVILAFTSICSTFDSAVFSASSSHVSKEFSVGLEVAVLSSSLYIVGYASGPLVWAPLSELQGRRIPIIMAMFGFGVFNIAVAVAKDLQTLLICRFFCGIFGSCPLAVVAAVFSDIWDNRTRGVAIAMFSSTVFLGPLVAPFIGGFINMSYLGWRWTAYIPAIMGFAAFILNVFFLKESYPPVVLVSKAAELRRRTKNWGIHAKQEEIEVDLQEMIVNNFSRPLRLLFNEPLILAVTLYLSFIYGLLYCFLTAYTLVFQGVYGMNPGVGGLPLFGMVAGLFIAATYILISSRGYNKKLDMNGGVPIPEWRLPPGNVHWIVPTLSGLFTGFGLLVIFIQLFNYLIDTYLVFAASAIAANTFCRSMIAASFPLFSRQMFQSMGIQWASTLLGCVAALLVPIPIGFYFFGKRLRMKSKFAPFYEAVQEGHASDDVDVQAEETAIHKLSSVKHIAQGSLSSNWAGAVRESPPASATYTYVAPTITVSTPTLPGNLTSYQAASAWAGIDGTTHTTAILRTRFDFYIINGESYPDGWYE
ncbi:Major facilitator superfamily domain general substrate transporter [Penicillium paradoxum]|uniref:Major facilitator superfamily domain general substrate transporter n=1 Tax=Penicillium paradoxum TaxID=176176 RepID=UPI00254800F4|nr:Major facilitator superfamily domain general substrate transporter [Penicillium paradoxum]KAJ5787307.1 Major facilitator superfamily domain general substrate transporter [Penicillium paradoxum]